MLDHIDMEQRKPHFRMFEILEKLSKSDPVYDTRVFPALPGTPASLNYSAVKMCALCCAHGGHNQENVRHNPGCPWMAARDYIANICNLP